MAKVLSKKRLCEFLAQIEAQYVGRIVPRSEYAPIVDCGAVEVFVPVNPPITVHATVHEGLEGLCQLRSGLVLPSRIARKVEPEAKRYPGRILSVWDPGPSDPDEEMRNAGIRIFYLALKEKYERRS